MSTGSQHPGLLHHYVSSIFFLALKYSLKILSHYLFQAPRLVAFEYGQSHQSSLNTIIFIGGLGDGLLTVPYLTVLAAALPLSYSLAQILLSSSYGGWGSSSLTIDVREIAQCVEYFRKLRPGGKIVLMGHSTGSQDVIHYLVSDGRRPPVDGGILQAAVSDRESLASIVSPDDFERGIKLAREYITDGRGKDILPSSITCFIYSSPVSANRFISLASPGPDHAGEDDYFSSDFDDARIKRTFGKAGSTGTRLSILLGDNDSSIPDDVDKAVLLEKWTRHIREGGGTVDEDAGIIPGASHTLREGGEPTEDLKRRVLGFIDRLEQRAA